METQKRRFRDKTKENNFRFMKEFYGNLQDREWHTEKDAVRLVVGKDKNHKPITVTIKESLEIPNCAINPRLLERTTGWVERKANTKLGMQIRWVAATPPTNAMMDKLTFVLDDQKNGKRNREIAAAKLQKQQEKAVVVENPVVETVVEVKEESATTAAEVILQHTDKLPTTRTELKEVMVEVLKEIWGDNFNTLFTQQKRMHDVFLEIAGVEKK